MGFLEKLMADIYEAKDKTTKALAAALNKACDALWSVTYADDLEEAMAIAETTNEEIAEELVARGVEKDFLPNV